MYSRWSVAIAICSVVFPTVAAVTVAFRFRARSMLSMKLLADDWLALTALTCAIATCATFLSGSINASIGQDLQDITPPQYVKYNQHIYAGVITTYASFGMVKLAVLQLYKRIFSVKKYVRIANGLMILVGMWMTATLLVSIFSAWPISDFWRLGASYIVNHPAFLFWSTLLDTALDFTILCFPMPIVWQLHVDLKKKLQLGAVFSMGFFCVIAAALRIYFGYLLSTTSSNTQLQVDNEKFNYIVVNNIIWCEIEACFSVVACCLPCFGPYLTILKPYFGSFSRVVSYLRSSSRLSRYSTSPAAKRSNNNSHELSESSSSRDLTEIGHSKETQTEESWGYNNGGIKVTRDIVVEFADSPVVEKRDAADQV